MSNSQNNTLKKTVTFLSLINFLAFLVYYVALYVFRHPVTLYIFYYLTELVSSLLPVLAATALFASYVKCGVNKSLLHALYFSMTWIINLFPYYAFEYAYQRLEIGAVLTFATIHTFFMIIVTYIEITVLFLLMIFVTEKIAKRQVGYFDKSIILKEQRPADFGSPVTVGIFSASAAMFVYNIISEIVDTVSYIRDVDGFYETGEIIYIVFRYFFILLLLLASHFISTFAKNKLTKSSD